MNGELDNFSKEDLVAIIEKLTTIDIRDSNGELITTVTYPASRKIMDDALAQYFQTIQTKLNDAGLGRNA